MASPPNVDLHAFHSRMVAAATSLEEFYEALNGWSDLAVEENPLLVCQDGCANCCKHQVMVGEREWELIHDWMRANMTKAQRQRVVGHIRARLEQPRNPLRRWLAMRNKHPRLFVRAVGQGFRAESTRCPFLDDTNRCEIYPVRPFVCRAYGRAELSDGRNMFCGVFLGRYRQEPKALQGMKLASMGQMSPKYFELTRPRGGGEGRYTIMSAHVLRHTKHDDDLVKRPIPLSTEKTYPVITRAGFPAATSSARSEPVVAELS